MARRRASRFAVVETTFPARPAGAAERFAAQALRARLAACGNVVAGVRSVYWWRGRVERAAEVLVSFKTTRARADRLAAWIRREHPYEVPFVGVETLDVRNASYASWLTAEARAPRGSGRARRPRRVRR